MIWLYFLYPSIFPNYLSLPFSLAKVDDLYYFISSALYHWVSTRFRQWETSLKNCERKMRVFLCLTSDKVALGFWIQFLTQIILISRLLTLFNVLSFRLLWYMFVRSWYLVSDVISPLSISSRPRDGNDFLLAALSYCSSLVVSIKNYIFVNIKIAIKPYSHYPI